MICSDRASNTWQTLEDSVVVVGAGAAGMSAALTATAAGANVLLVEAGPAPGGTVTGALIHTLGGIYDQSGQLLNQGIIETLTERLFKAASSVQPRQIGRTWTLSVCPETYRKVVVRLLEAEPRLTTLYNTRVRRVIRRADRLEQIELEHQEEIIQIFPRAVIDTTGVADVVRMVDPELVHDDEQRAAGGLIFRLQQVTPGTLDFPQGTRFTRSLRKAVREGRLPVSCSKAWLDRGVLEDEVYVKLFVPLIGQWRDPTQQAHVVRCALSVRDSVIDFLRQDRAFSRSILRETGALGIRDGGRVQGEYVLTENDVRGGKKFSDAVCRCCWPVEYWDPVEGVSMEYLAEGSYYEIPLRSLVVKGFTNFWIAGKCLSSDHRAQASARVVGSCWTMGQAVGEAAAAL